MSNFYVRLEPFAGGDIETAVRDLPFIANRMGVWVKARLNGIEVLVSPHDSSSVLWANYQKARERNADFVSANVVPQGRTALIASPESKGPDHE
jgi:hypothetical protein